MKSAATRLIAFSAMPATQQIILKQARAPFINSMIMYLPRKAFLISSSIRFFFRENKNNNKSYDV
jgi:hypothetical protein